MQIAAQDALEATAVQSFLDIRKRELSYISTKYNAVMMQAGLLAGYAVTAMMSVVIDASIPQVLMCLFCLTSAVSIIASVSCVLNSTFVTIWGNNLALRGPRGSTAEAYHGMVFEHSQIFGSFSIAVVFYALQLICVSWMFDRVTQVDEMGIYFEWNKLVATFTILFGLAHAAYLLDRMYKRFHAICPDDNVLRPSLPFNQITLGKDNVEDSAYGADGNTSLSSLNPPEKHALTGILKPSSFWPSFASSYSGLPSTPSSSVSSAAFSPGISPSPDASSQGVPLTGYLYKKADIHSALSLKYANPWDERFFVCHSGRLHYYNSESDWRSGRPPRGVGKDKAEPLILSDYDVLVNPKDLLHAFRLQPRGGGGRPFDFRAKNEEERMAWIKTLLRETLKREEGGGGANGAASIAQ